MGETVALHHRSTRRPDVHRTLTGPYSRARFTRAALARSQGIIMNASRHTYLICALLCFAGIAEGDNALKPQVTDVEASKDKAKQSMPMMGSTSARTQCIARCESAN